MKKIIDGLFVGTADEVDIAKDNGFSILGVCKDPLHRKHARPIGSDREGYIVKALPKDDPEYLFAERGHELYCNLIDAQYVRYISRAVIQRSLRFIYDELKIKNKVLVACNKAESRSPSICLMYLIEMDTFSKDKTFEEVLANFLNLYYPFYNPGSGMLEYTRRFWEEYRNA